MHTRPNLLAALLAVALLGGLYSFALASPPDPDAPDVPEIPEVEPEDEPELPGITVVEPGTDIKKIPSDSFTLVGAEIENDVLKITVTYAGGAEDHEFALYWNGISTRSLPPRLPMVLKHNANGDNAEALITKTLEFELSAINKPSILNISTDHGGKARVEYGSPKRP